MTADGGPPGRRVSLGVNLASRGRPLSRPGRSRPRRALRRGCRADRARCRQVINDGGGRGVSGPSDQRASDRFLCRRAAIGLKRLGRWKFASTIRVNFHQTRAGRTESPSAPRPHGLLNRRRPIGFARQCLRPHAATSESPARLAIFRTACRAGLAATCEVGESNCGQPQRSPGSLMLTRRGLASRRPRQRK